MSGTDGYHGPAELIVEHEVIAVRVRLSGQVDPISGRYQWYGRIAANDQVDAIAGRRAVWLRTPTAEVEARVADRDLWGRFRVTGTGTPPFAVTTTFIK